MGQRQLKSPLDSETRPVIPSHSPPACEETGRNSPGKADYVPRALFLILLATTLQHPSSSPPCDHFHATYFIVLPPLILDPFSNSTANHLGRSSSKPFPRTYLLRSYSRDRAAVHCPSASDIALASTHGGASAHNRTIAHQNGGIKP